MRVSALDVAIALCFAFVVVAAGTLLTIPVPLYLTDGCPGNYCFPNIPHVPVVPLVAGIAVAALFWRDRRPAIIAGGLLLGVSAALYSGLVRVGAIPFADAYITTPYRGYALVYVAVVSALLSAWAFSRGSSERWRWLGWPLLAVIVVSIGAAFARRELPIAAAAAAGLLVGPFLQRLLARHRKDALLRSHTELVAVAGLAFVACAARAFFGLQTLFRSATPEVFATASDDGDSYYMLATRLSGDFGLLRETLAGFAYPPGYTGFLAVIFAATGNSLAAVVLIQALLGAALAVLVYILAARIAGRPAALLAGTFVALDMNLIQLGSTLTAEAILLTLSVGSVWALVRYRSSGRLRWLAAAAALLGYAFVVRNIVALPLIIAALAWLAFTARTPLTAVRDAAVIVCGVLLLAAPIAVATAARDGTPRLTTQLASLTWRFHGSAGYTVSNEELIALGIRPFDDPIGSLGAAVADPGAVVRFYLNAAPQRLSTLLFKAPVGLSDPLLIVNPVIYPNSFDAMVRVLRLLGLIVAGVVVLRTRWWRRYPEISLMVVFALLYTFAFTFVFAPYHAFRYRAPLEPFRFIAEAAGVWLMLSAALSAIRAAVDRRRAMSAE